MKRDIRLFIGYPFSVFVFTDMYRKKVISPNR